jgi:hypothetical protein
MSVTRIDTHKDSVLYATPWLEVVPEIADIAWLHRRCEIGCPGFSEPRPVHRGLPRGALKAAEAMP